MTNRAKHAIDRSIKSVNNLIAPIGIILVIKDFEQALGFLMLNPITALFIFSFFIGVFIYNLYRIKLSNLDAQSKSKQLDQDNSEQAQKVNSKQKLKRFNYKTISIVIAFIGLLFIAISIFIGSYIGLHYPLVQSFSSKQDTKDKVEEINEYLNEQGIVDLKATYIKSWTNDYYGVILNGYSLSARKAEREFQKAKEVMPHLLFTNPNNLSDTSRVAHIYWGPLKK